MSAKQGVYMTTDQMKLFFEKLPINKGQRCIFNDEYRFYYDEKQQSVITSGWVDFDYTNGKNKKYRFSVSISKCENSDCYVLNCYDSDYGYECKNYQARYSGEAYHMGIDKFLRIMGKLFPEYKIEYY